MTDNFHDTMDFPGGNPQRFSGFSLTGSEGNGWLHQGPHGRIDSIANVSLAREAYHMRLDVDPAIRTKWQALLDSLAELARVPAALIMHVQDPHIEVYGSSRSDGNPYSVGDREEWQGSGLYCEWVIKNRRELLVSNAVDEPDWADNPDIKLGMVAYLGFPICQPGGEVFGTLCILDSQANSFSPLIERVMLNYREMLEAHLLLLDQRRRLMRTLQGILPICSVCKKIRDEENNWHHLEDYLVQHTAAELSHGLCPVCLEQFMPDLT